jgi:hypothetical protein
MDRHPVLKAVSEKDWTRGQGHSFDPGKHHFYSGSRWWSGEPLAWKTLFGTSNRPEPTLSMDEMVAYFAGCGI